MADWANEPPAIALSTDEEKSARKEAKRLKKLEKSLDTRAMDPWERYRALTDLFDSYTDVTELLDRKTRFALLILGAVNAMNLVIVVRPEVFREGIDRSWLAICVGTYMGLSLYLFFEAITALKPRYHSMVTKAPSSDPVAEDVKLRFMGDVAAQNPEAYYESWRNAEIGDVNRELALQTQELARVNLAKFAALNRLYRGLLVLVLLTATLLSVLAYRALTI